MAEKIMAADGYRRKPRYHCVDKSRRRCVAGPVVTDFQKSGKVACRSMRLLISSDSRAIPASPVKSAVNGVLSRACVRRATMLFSLTSSPVSTGGRFVGARISSETPSRSASASRGARLELARAVPRLRACRRRRHDLGRTGPNRRFRQHERARRCRGNRRRDRTKESRTEPSR
jgi:hypothetical protein